MGKQKKASGKHEKNSDRRNGKSSKQHPGVSPGAHNGHSIGGYSISRYGREMASELAEHHTRPMNERRAAQRLRRTAKHVAARAA